MSHTKDHLTLCKQVPAETPPKVVFISPFASTIVGFRGSLIKALKKYNIHVVVLAPDYDDKTRWEVSALGAIPVDYALNRAGITPLRDLRTLLQLSKLLRRLKPSVVMPYNIKPVVYGMIAGAVAGVPYRVAMIEGLGYTFCEKPSLRHTLLSKTVRLLYRVGLRFAHKVLFLNPDDVREFLEARLVRAEQAVLLGGIGVDLHEWCSAHPSLKPVTFTLAARLIREKGIPEFAQAARHIKAKYPNTRFWLLGGLDTNLSALSQHEVEAWVREGILEWFGQVPDVRPYFAQTSVYVLPSYYREGVPRSTQEAMAMARPVITTDAPGCRETVVDGVNGYLVPVRDVEALVQAMERFIQEPRLIITMGQASRKLAEERFDVHQINRRILKVIGLLPEETGDDTPCQPK